MFGINANAKKSIAIATIAVAGVMGAANASAQQYWMEEVLEQQLAEKAAKAEQESGKSQKVDREADKPCDRES